ncbi:MAG: S-methyl-5-thioribose-1-phosphate isomerase [Anaerolineae bacterium]|nr:S-methyl-5-thioribose-1-phosphate isomerase [Anaerolineae bacterium]
MCMRTIWWEDNFVRMIDQRLLPGRLEVPAYNNYQDVAWTIKEMVIRGAPAIGAAAGFGMVLAARQSQATTRAALLADLERAGDVLRAARPTAVNLSWGVERLLRRAQDPALETPDAIRVAMLAEAQALADEDVEVNKRMGRNGAAVIPDGARILHHCNTGSLATVDYGTALGVVRAAHEEGKRVHVWVDETRPRLQGARLTAWELMQDEIPMTLIADNAAGLLMRTGQVDVVLYGADRVAANGDVANKVGSYNVAVLAQENGIPCYSVVPTSTIDLNLPTGDDIPIEQRPAEEVTMVGGVRIAPEHVAVYNPAFDVTPHRYLTGIITEEGIVYPPFREGLRRVKETAEARRR